MFEQISLPGIDTKSFRPGSALEPKPDTRPRVKSDNTDRIFFAVLPDVDAITTIRRHTLRLREQHNLWGRPIIDGRLHVSLLGLGDYRGIPVSSVKAAWHAANLVLLPSFDVSFDKVLTFTGKNADPSRQKPCVLVENTSGKGLVGLQNSLISSMQKFGFSVKQSSSFTPHMTLLYDKKHLPTDLLTPVAWKVREFVLVRSQIGDASRPYEVLGRWSLLDEPVKAARVFRK
jgi:2'-5' RNA ligase